MIFRNLQEYALNERVKFLGKIITCQKTMGEYDYLIYDGIKYNLHDSFYVLPFILVKDLLKDLIGKKIKKLDDDNIRRDYLLRDFSGDNLYLKPLSHEVVNFRGKQKRLARKEEYVKHDLRHMKEILESFINKEIKVVL